MASGEAEIRTDQPKGTERLGLFLTKFGRYICSVVILLLIHFGRNLLRFFRMIWEKQELDAGRDVILEIDTKGAAQVRRLMPQAVLIFLEPPSPEELLRRLQTRGTDSPEEIARRQQCLQEELNQRPYYNFVVVNDELSRAVAEIQGIIAG